MSRRKAEKKNKQPICNYALIPVEKKNTPGPWLTCFGEFIILWKMSGILFCRHSLGTKQAFHLSAVGAIELFVTICWANGTRRRNALQKSYTCWPLGAPSPSCFSWPLQNPLQGRQNSWLVNAIRLHRFPVAPFMSLWLIYTLESSATHAPHQLQIIPHHQRLTFQFAQCRFTVSSWPPNFPPPPLMHHHFISGSLLLSGAWLYLAVTICLLFSRRVGCAAWLH